MNTKQQKIKEILELEGFYKSSHMILSKILESFKDPILQSKAQKYFIFDELVEKIIPTYETQFNESELDQIISFYKTDIGKKIVLFKEESNFTFNEILKQWVTEKHIQLSTDSESDS